MKQIGSLVAALLVSACANTSTGTSNTDIAFHARLDVIGLSRAQVLACAGKPERTVVSGETESFSYSASSGETTLMIGGGSVLSNVRHACNVTYVLRRGYVEDVVYTGARTGGTTTPDAECAPVVKKCLGAR